MPPELTVVGSVNLDLVARCDRLPRPGETVSGATLERVPGGKGANQALAAARLGAHVTLVGCVGADPFAGEATRLLVEGGVELELETADVPTGVALIAVDGSGENTIVVAPGANGRIDPGRVPESAAALCQLEIPLAAVTAAAERSRFFALNAAPARPTHAALLERADLVVVNRYEREMLSAEPRGLLAITLGPEGAVLVRAGREVASARPPVVETVDGTGAGDAFTACLVVSLLEGRPHGDALTRACAAGALAASRPGAQPSLPTAAEVDAILRA